MAHIEDRGSGGRLRWRVRWRDPAGRHRSKSFERKADADRYLHSLSVDLDQGTWRDPRRAEIIIADYAERWYSTRLARWKPSTAASQRNLLDSRVLPRWGRYPIGAIEYAEAAEWVADLARSGLSASRVRHCAGVLAAILDHAVRDRRLVSNPVRGIDLPRLPIRPRHVYLTHEQVAALAGAIGRHRPLILLLAYCGLRWSEAVALRPRDIDPARRRITIDRALVDVGGEIVEGAPKTWHHRSVPIPGIVLDEIRPLLEREPDEPLFRARRGSVLRASNFRARAWSPALEAAGLPPMRIHELRHTAASLAVSSGANVLAVARMLGHRDPSVTLGIYADLFDSDLDDVAARLDSAARAAISGGTVVPIRSRRE